MTFERHAQSCFRIETFEGTRLLFDPGSFVREIEALPASELEVQAILITHEHPDHADPTLIREIVELTSARVISNQSVADILAREEIEVEVLPPGGETSVETVQIQGVALEHGPLPQGRPIPELLGFWISDGRVSLLAPGDTKAIPPEPKADVYFLPIAGAVLDWEDAKKAMRELAPRLVLICHNDNPKYPVDPQEFLTFMAETMIPIRFLRHGESLEIQ